jgi:Zn-dependent protease with chaperone function
MALNRAWLGVAFGGLLSAFLIYALYPRHPRPKGVVATRQQFPRLAAALDEVSKRIEAPAPHRVVLVPGTQVYVYQHRPWRRFFLRELMLGLGAGALPLLTEQDLKAVLAHELAHYRHGDTALHKYFGRAEMALYHIIDMFEETVRSQTYMASGYRRRYGASGGVTLIAALVLWLVTLPLRVLWWVFHLLRLAESRQAEFAADQVAAWAYGPQAFMRGLTGIIVATNTLRGSGASLRAEMIRQGGENIYAVLRDHYAGLPPNVIGDLRARAIKGFRSLEQTHPIDPDRLRAVSLLSTASAPPASEAAQPAVNLIVPAGAQDAEEVERKLTALLLKR